MVGLYTKEREPRCSVGTGNQIPVDSMLETRSLAPITVLMAALVSLSVCLGKSACEVLINSEAHNIIQPVFILPYNTLAHAASLAASYS